MANQQVPEKVVRILMRDIFNNKLKPGTKLPPAKEISRQMKVDLSSLRIGLKQLESMNLLDIRQGDGIYVKDYVQHAGIDFLSLLFSQKDENEQKMIVDDYFVDEIWEFWTAVFPEILKMAAGRFSPRDVKVIVGLMNEELANLDDREKVIELQEKQQDLVVKVANNTIFLLLANSTRPMRRKIIEIFVHSIDRKTLEKFAKAKVMLIKEYTSGALTNSLGASEKYREMLFLTRQAVKTALSQRGALP
jgi:GntR family transcriptional regulator, transcriptional repressor for pyruvate dehydrogenase complex